MCLQRLVVAVLAFASASAAARDVSLAEAERLFAQRNRELQSAQRAVEGADADRISAAARPNPNMFMNATQFGNLYPRGYDASRLDRRFDIVLGLSQTFERGGKRELRTTVADANAGAARRDRDEVRRQQLFGLRAAYYDLVLAQERVRIASQTVASFGKTVDALALRLKAGDIARSEVARIHVDALRAENDARAARAEREKAQAALAYLIGLEREAGAIVAMDAWPAAVAVAAPADLERIVGERPDVASAQLRLKAAEARRELARASRTRDVSGSVQVERAPWYPLAGPTSATTFGFGVSVPLFTNYYFEGEIRRAEVEVDAARENLDRARALALGEISRSRAELDSAIERVRRFQDVLLKEAQTAAAAAEFAYSHGAAGVMDLLDSRRQLYGTQLEAIAAQADYAKALAAWRASQSTVGMLGSR